MSHPFKILAFFTIAATGAAIFDVLIPNPTSAQEVGGIYQASPSEAKPQLTRMTDAQHTTLKSLSMRIVVPGYIPQGFQVVGITTEPCAPSGCRVGRPSYSIIYRSPRKACFEIEGTSGGVGGPALEHVVPVTSKLFGSTEVGFYPNNHLSSDWLSLSPSSGPFYRLYSREGYPRGCATRITPKEAVQIVKSLKWLP
jgi:hypothetical protein